MSRSVFSGGNKWSYNRGAAVVELALLLPIFIALVAAIIDFGRMTYHHNLLNKAVREAGRYLSTQPPGNFVDPGIGAGSKSWDVARQLIAGYQTQLCPGTTACLTVVIEDATRDKDGNTGPIEGDTSTLSNPNSALLNVQYGTGTFNLVRVTVSGYEMPTLMLGAVLQAMGQSDVVIPTVSATFVQE